MSLVKNNLRWPYCIPLFVLCVKILVCAGVSSEVSFDFSTLTLGSLKLLGDAHLNNGSIRLSRDLPVPNSGAGRALFADPVRLRHPTTGAALPFSTFFSFTVANLNPSSIGGGLAFLITSDDSGIGDPGGFLGLISRAGGGPGVVAVEFDTLMDVEFDDINGNHVGVDINSMVSEQVVDLTSAGIDFKSGNLVNVWIDYDRGVLQVSISYSNVRPESSIIAFPVDLAKYVDDLMFVGFSGSTQGSTEIHNIEWWSFSSSLPTTPASPPPPPFRSSYPVSPKNSASSPPSAIAPSFSASIAEGPSNGSIVKSPSSSSCQSNNLCRQGPAAVAGVATAGAFFIVALAAMGIWAFHRKSKSPKKWDGLVAATEILKTPREFSYNELVAATGGFSSARIIGHGAFGTVYKGIILETGAMVAVKRCIKATSSHGGEQGRAEFLSELSIIASLRHRNLVRLQGWCQERGEILLVYDFMRHGSLDKALFDSAAAVLPWRHRRKILAGVASALAYLHHECERLVIHRDVKSSNVLLDEDFHPRLGDFGLARQVDHDRSPDATVTAGTMGYLAPEYLQTGRASDKTDVFSFGALVLEVASGRRPIDESGGRLRGSLVEWVWRLHGEGKLLEAADARLDGEFNVREMSRVLLIGLACSSTDPGSRPGMRSVVQMLNGEAETPSVPAKPSMSLSSNHHLLLSLQDSISDYNAIGFNLSSSFSSSSSLTSILKAAGGGGGAAASSTKA